MKEPSVLDYVKSILMPWKGERIVLPQPGEPAVFPDDRNQRNEPGDPDGSGDVLETAQARVRVYIRPKFLYRTYLAVLFAILAQSGLDTSAPLVVISAVLYFIAGFFLVWALIVKEWQVVDLSEDAGTQMPLKIRLGALGFSIPLFVIAYISFADNKFSIYNLLIGGLLVAYMVYVFFVTRTPQDEVPRLQSKPFWTDWDNRIHITPWHLAILAAFILVLFFRFYRLDSVPNEMISDHAEKLMDVGDVLNGQTSIFFPRNTGREPFQFYLTAWIAELFGTGISFLSLKIGTALAGVVTLVFVYLLGKEVANRRVGLLAMILTGVAYWPNVISRIGLRFALYPLFVAPLLYFIVRGLRRQNRNDFIWAGIALGIGLHGYSPMRIVPFVLLILILLYMLHRQAAGKRNAALIGLAIVAGVSLAVLLPLVRYALENPQNMAMLGLRAFSRLGTPGQEYPAPPLQIFFSNLWNAWAMIFTDNGEIWAHSVPHRPALDLVSTTFYFIGTLVTIFQYIRTRHWVHLFLLVSIPLLMMPSILSLTFPGENPSLNRTAAAYVPVFILAAIGLEGFLVTLWSKVGTASRSWITVGATAVIILWSSLLNYDLVFNQYANLYAQSSWNTSEMGAVARGFTETFGEESSVWVVAYPYWVDGRLVAINANQSQKDFSIFGDRLSTTLQVPGAKLFLLSAEDQKDLEILQQLYPQGMETIRPGNRDKNFITFIVPEFTIR